MNKQLLRAVTIMGSQSELARCIGSTQGAVWQWLNGKQFPAHRCALVESATRGLVTCEQLRPDLDWLRDSDGRAFYRERMAA